MQKLKLVLLLEGFTPAEFKRLGEFIRSPFYNKNKNLVLLYEYFEKFLYTADHENNIKEEIWDYLCPDKKYDDSKLRSVFSEFKRLCETFLIVIKNEQNPINQKNVLLEVFSERNLPKNFELISKDISKIFNIEFNRNYEFYANKINFERHQITIGGKNIEKNLDENFMQLSDSIDYFFLSSKLDLINSLLSRKYHVLGNLTLKIKFIDEIITHVEENIKGIIKDHPLIYSEYLILKMMTAAESEKYFTNLHGFVLKNINKYKQSELEQVYFPLINYGFNKVALGESKYLEKIFEIYQTFERRNFYSEMIEFQDIDFISIAIAGLRLNKILWVENFTDKYNYKLSEKNKDDSKSLVSALISHKKKNYEKAISSLCNVNYQNSYYYLKSKETLMQIYYEQKEFEALQSLIDSTRHYLKRRQNILSIHYERYMMFLKYINMLLTVREDKSYKKLVLKKELNKNKNVIAREWLLEKMKDL